jgi:hypothetical protein
MVLKVGGTLAKGAQKILGKPVARSSKICIPGLFCIENMTMLLLFIVVVILIYLYYINVAGPKSNHPNYQSTLGNPAVVMVSEPTVLPDALMPIMGNGPVRVGSLENPYVPPVNNTDVMFPMDVPVVTTRGLPVNMRTRGQPGGYSPVGILTRMSGSGEMVLPLMGRQSAGGRDKYQYYTMMTNGTINPKLPVSVNGKSCTSEYGCNEISNGDVVYVDGINDTFRATIYENDAFTYIPY